MSGTLPNFTGTDAWILLTIAMCDNKKGASVRDVIAVGDYINHAIFNASELRSGFAKLAHCGYVEDVNNLFFLSGKAREFWATLNTTRRRVSTLQDAFDTFLGVTRGPDSRNKEDDADWQYPRLTDEVVEQVYQEYVRDFWATAAKRKKTNKR